MMNYDFENVYRFDDQKLEVIHHDVWSCRNNAAFLTSLVPLKLSINNDVMATETQSFGMNVLYIQV